MAYVTIPGKSGYLTGTNPGSTASNAGGLRMYWELRCYTSAETPTIMGKSYSCAAGSYKIYYKLQAWFGIQISSLCRLIQLTGTSSPSYVRLRNGTTNLWEMIGQDRTYNSRNPSFGDNNPANTWYNVADATDSDYKVYPEGLISVTEGATLSLNLSYAINIWYSNSYNANAEAVSSSTSVNVSGGKFSLSISQGTGSSVVVKRGGTSLSSGAAIYLGDSLTVTFAANVGYRLTSTTVNGSPFSSGDSLTVTGAVSVAASATRLSYTLSFSADGGSTVTVKRNGSALSSGSTIYYGDALVITAAAKSGYEIKTATINGAAFTSPKSLSVTGNVTVVVTSSALGFAYIRRSGVWTPYLIYIRRSGAWVRYRAYVRRNGAWTAY